ncbi:MAG: hypothetical protein ACRD50_07610 [Candidatus Acidiferrales bacterium]
MRQSSRLVTITTSSSIWRLYIESCDYSLVDADAAGDASPIIRTNNPHAQMNVAQKNLLRNRIGRRFGLRGQRPVPQN